MAERETAVSPHTLDGTDFLDCFLESARHSQSPRGGQESTAGRTVLVVADNLECCTSEFLARYGTFLACTFSGSCSECQIPSITTARRDLLFPREVAGQAEYWHEDEHEVEDGTTP